MKTIHKYHIPVEDTVDIWMPVGAKVLTVQSQNDRGFIWALVDVIKPEAVQGDTNLRRFHTLGTGHPVGDRKLGEYIGTYQLHGGSLVFHVFEVSNV